MVTHRVLAALLLMLTAGAGLLPVQAQSYSARNLSLAQGLPEYYVSGLSQDKAGFVWVATRDGLARYDGRNFKIFRHQARRVNSLLYNVIMFIQPVNDSTLLLALENGAYQLFNPITERFSPLRTGQKTDPPSFGWQLSADQQWLFERRPTSLRVVNRRSRRQRVQPIPSFNPPGVGPVGVPFLEAAPRRLYAAVTGGVLTINPQTGQHHRWPHPGIGEFAQNHTYYQVPMAQRVSGELMLGGVGQLILFQSATHHFRSVPVPARLRFQVSLIQSAPDGNVYFCHGMTLYRLAPDDQITPLWTAPRIEYMNYFRSMLIDRSGVCWLGTNGDGIFQIDLRQLPFRAYPYQKDFAHDLLHIEMGFPGPTWTSVDASYRTRFEGVAPYVASLIDNRYQVVKGDRQRRTLRPILSITQLHPNATWEGLRALPTGQLVLYHSYHQLWIIDTTGRVSQRDSLGLEAVADIQPLGKWLFIGSNRWGLYAYDLRHKRIRYRLHHNPAQPHSLPTDNVLCLAVDPVNPAVLWIGLLGEGLCRFNTHSGRYRLFTEKDGLPNATIQTLLPDQRGNLWFSTLKGISRLDTRTGRMRHFTQDDGLQDIEYKHRHAAQLPGGRLAFGGLTGMTVFAPLAIPEDTFALPSALVALRINNRPVDVDQPGSPLPRPLNSLSTLLLDYTQNFISLDFAGLQFNKPATLQYRYQLVGVDADWVYAGSTTTTSYTRLPPGRYTFRVNAANTSGRWSPHVKTLSIVITPPWWATWWAYVGYGLLLLGAIWQFTQIRIRQVSAQREAGHLRALNDAKAQFFTTITHELRTPLTLILSPVEALLTSLSNSPHAHSLRLIQRSAQQLLELINQLLELARLDARFMPVAPMMGSLTDFLSQLVQPFAEQAARQQLTFSYQSEVAHQYWFDSDKLERIVTNLLANAFKFTPTGGHVTLHLKEADGILLTVADSGIGISPDHLPYVFERFYQASPLVTDPAISRGDEADGHRLASSGIGLALVKELVELQGGQISLHSQPGQGTTVLIKLPYRLADQATPPASVSAGRIDSDEEGSADESGHVLLVEDNPDLLAFLSQNLPARYRISQATNGQSGLELALESLPDLIISDVMMPGLDGYELVQRLGADQRTSHIPVLLLTAKTALDHRLEGLSKGAADYLTKPFHLSELLVRVANLLGRQQRFREQMQQSLATPAETELPAEMTDPFLSRVLAVLAARYPDAGFDVEALADELAISRKHLTRKIKVLTGLTTTELMRNYRLKKALCYLEQGLSSTETAYQVGFQNPAYFSKCFREQYGQPPLAYSRGESSGGDQSDKD